MKDGLVVFDNKKIRRVWHEDDWWFSVVDVVGVLTESSDGRKYWNKLIQRLREEGSEMVTNCHQLKLKSSDGKNYLTDCANKQGLFRIIQSIPSKKAEPFKLWLAKVGSDRVDEIDDPELSIDRAMKSYLAKGYSEKWINQRLKTRINLTSSPYAFMAQNVSVGGIIFDGNVGIGTTNPGAKLHTTGGDVIFDI